MTKYRPDMTDAETRKLMEEIEALDACYQQAGEIAASDDETEDPVRDGWVDKQGRP